MLRMISLCAGALLVAACAETYVYRPTENVSATVEGRAAARYDVPPEQPRGEVRVASFGVATFENGDGEVRVLHVRMVVENNSGAPWTVDTRQQIASIPGAGDSRPAWASTSGAGRLPVIQVPAGGKRTLDLFYPLPEDMQKESRIPEFDFVWRVQTDTRLIAERTPFDRLRVEPLYASGYYGWGGFYGPGWGPSWWYDPYWPSWSFYRRPIIIGPSPEPVIVAPPRW